MEDVQKTLPFLPRPVAAMVQIQLLTGCRTEEVLSIALGDRTRRAELGVHAFLAQECLARPAACHPDRTPGSSDTQGIPGAGPGRVPVSPRDAVEAIHEQRRQSRKSKPTPSELGKRLDSPGIKHGLRYNGRSYRQAIIRACRKAEIPAWTPLQLRHTAATIVRARYGLEAAQTVLGHAKADVTQIYAERDLARAHSVMAEIG